MTRIGTYPDPRIARKRLQTRFVIPNTMRILQKRESCHLRMWRFLQFLDGPVARSLPSVVKTRSLRWFAPVHIASLCPLQPKSRKHRGSPAGTARRRCSGPDSCCKPPRLASCSPIISCRCPRSLRTSCGLAHGGWLRFFSIGFGLVRRRAALPLPEAKSRHARRQSVAALGVGGVLRLRTAAGAADPPLQYRALLLVAPVHARRAPPRAKPSQFVI